MKILMLTCNAPNQIALANKIHSVQPLAGLVSISGPGSASTPQVRWIDVWGAQINRVIRGIGGRPLGHAWRAMQRYYALQYDRFPEVQSIKSTDVNSSEVIALIEEIRPDLTIVSGTNLLRQPLIEAISKYGKVMNLHTGISPYVKGGPNCTNWCLAINEPSLIGNTVMWLDAGIDSGNLVVTERTPLDGVGTLTQLHIRVMEHAHDIYIQSIQRFVGGMPMQSVPQNSLPNHRLFYSRQWTLKEILRAQASFKRHAKTGFRSIQSSVSERLIPLSPSLDQ